MDICVCVCKCIIYFCWKVHFDLVEAWFFISACLQRTIFHKIWTKNMHKFWRNGAKEWENRAVPTSTVLLSADTENNNECIFQSCKFPSIQLQPLHKFRTLRVLAHNSTKVFHCSRNRIRLFSCAREIRSSVSLFW